MGDILLMSGDIKGALNHYLKEAIDWPTSWYSAALIKFRAGDFMCACTYVRKGIAGNPYVAEGLTGRTFLTAHLYWHGTNSCDQAIDYLESIGNEWCDEECDFVDWVFNSAPVLLERAALTDLHVALTVERDPERRGVKVTKKLSFIEGIDDRLSKQIVRQITNRWGDKIWPWDRRGHAHSAAARASRN